MKENPERVKLHDRNVRLRRKYGITDAEYQQMHDNQHGRCAMCGRKRLLVIDHDHTTKLVRALLCEPCNKGIGFLKDDIKLLRKGITYLEQYQ
jgi:hypothetical protein